jgi:hypothetical protein
MVGHSLSFTVTFTTKDLGSQFTFCAWPAHPKVSSSRIVFELRHDTGLVNEIPMTSIVQTEQLTLVSETPAAISRTRLVSLHEED